MPTYRVERTLAELTASNAVYPSGTVINVTDKDITKIGDGVTAFTSLLSPSLVVGGTAGQVLSKIDSTDFNTQWVTPSGGSSSLLLDYTVSTAAVSIVFNGLDINAHGGYHIEATYTVADNLYLFVNSDLTVANYAGFRIYPSSSSALGASSVTDPRVGAGTNNNTAYAIIDIPAVNKTGGIYSAIYIGQYYGAIQGAFYNGAVSNVATTFANITTLTFRTSSGTNTFPVGTNFKIYKKVS